MRARGVRPWARRPFSLTTSSAAAASAIELETAAVSRPRSTRVGSERILAQSGRRGGSSALRPKAGRISRSKRPSAAARNARSCEVTANRSMSSRLMSHFSAIISADRNWEISWSP